MVLSSSEHNINYCSCILQSAFVPMYIIEQNEKAY